MFFTTDYSIRVCWLPVSFDIIALTIMSINYNEHVTSLSADNLLMCNADQSVSDFFEARVHLCKCRNAIP